MRKRGRVVPALWRNPPRYDFCMYYTKVFSRHGFLKEALGPVRRVFD
jgi:hypothetical protein